MENTYIFVLMNLWEATGEKKKDAKTSSTFKSVNLDEAINFEKKMSQRKIQKKSLTDTPWPTVTQL